VRACAGAACAKLGRMLPHFLRCWLFACLGSVVLGQDVPAPLTSLRAIRELDRPVAGKELPVQVRAVVTFISPAARGSFFIADEETGLFVATMDALRRGMPAPEQNFEGLPKPGMLLEITGIATQGGFAPVIVPRKFHLLGTAPLPPVKPVAVADLLTGRLDCERVRVRGVVQHADFTDRQIDAVRLELAAVGGHFVGYALRPEGFDPAKLVDAEVDLSGLALSFFNERGELVGARVQLQGIEDVQIVRAAPENPFAAPETPLDALLPFSADPPSLHRRRVTGTVTVCRPGEYFYLQEGHRAIRVNTRETTRLMPGDRVEVAGFAELWQSFAEVREAVFRKIGTAPVPDPEPIDYEEVMAVMQPRGSPNAASHLDGRRVALRGRLDKVEGSDASGRRISLDCDGHIVFATLANEEPHAALEKLVPGSEVNVIGACQVQLSVGRPTLSNPVPTDFQLLVNSPEDVAVLRVPPWWTPQRLSLALGGTGAVLALALTWAWLLRRRVTYLVAETAARQSAVVEFEATLRERKRLAADLHDTLEQALTGLALQLEAAEIFRTSEPERGTHHLKLARQFLSRSREDVRRSVWNLRAQGLEGRTLAEALRESAASQSDSQTVRMAVEVEGAPIPLPDFIAGNLLLLAQEAMTNALKHASANSISARVRFNGDGVAVAIEDDGCGFDPVQAPGQKDGHFGLQGMRERVKRLGDTLEIESRVGTGTRVVAHVPSRAFNIPVDA
jgi:signal transduction histidine kinase